MASPIKNFTIEELFSFVEEKNVKEHSPNTIKVSATENPMYFPVSNTYQIGSSEIVAMCSNAIAVGTGQTGDAPLYVFCKDGIYALFVDASGQMTYTNARVIARDVCNNPKSVLPIDEGVVFTTDRGLMMIAGNEVVEIGQPLEGDFCKFTSFGHADYNTICKNAYTLPLLAGLSEDSATKVEFLEYLKDSIVAYNHNERELMICNLLRVQKDARLYPKYNYAYVLDRNGNWTRRDFSADQFVENYPVTYRVTDGELIQVDKDTDGDNGIFAMSNVLKLDSIGFKSIDRIVARGLFDTCEKEVLVPIVSHNEYKDIYDSLEVDEHGINTSVCFGHFSVFENGRIKMNIRNFHIETNDGHFDDVYLSVVITNKRSGFRKKIDIEPTSSGDDNMDFFFNMEDRDYGELRPGIFNYDIFIGGTIVGTGDYTCESIDLVTESYTREKTQKLSYAGIYAFGSYDGRKWVCLGHNERKGNFTDLGCNVERTDCKFFRFVLAGQLKKDSRIDYFEVSEKQSRLSTKIR